MNTRTEILEGRDQLDKTRRKIQRALRFKLGLMDHAEAHVEAMRGNDLLDRSLTAMAIEFSQAFGYDSRDDVEAAGHLVRAFTKGELADAWSNTANSALRKAFETTSEIWPFLVREGGVNDFRPATRSAVGMAGGLPKKAEDAEYLPATLKAEKVDIQLGPFGTLIPFTRELILADADDQLRSILRDAGTAAAITVGDKFVGDLTANPVFAPDGFDIFSAGHNNVAGGSNIGTLSVVTLTKARLALRRQAYLGDIGLSGRTHRLNTPARYIVVPAALETVAEQLIGAELPVDAGVQPLTVLVDSRLDDDSETAWYVFADPATLPVYEVSGLGGPPRPRVAMEYDNRADRFDIRIQLDFGGAFVDYRGAFRNAGSG